MTDANAHPTKFLVWAIQDVWQAIALDVSVGNNEEAIEACVDADRLNPSAGLNQDDGAHLEWRLMCKKFGPTSAIEQLAKHPSLQFV
jgi:hypothetical protein